jgi:hypothetical protein
MAGSFIGRHRAGGLPRCRKVDCDH